MGNAIILDTETTGVKDPEVIEMAWMNCFNEYVGMITLLSPDEVFCARFCPSKPIEYGAMATHFITDDQLLGLPPSASARLPDGTEYLIGHNIDYDWGVIGKPDVKRICTLAIARKLWPELDSHKLLACLYFLNPKAAAGLARSAHGARADVFINNIVMNHMLCHDQLKGIKTYLQLWEFSEAARVPEVMSFGKHKGQRVADVPADYKRWLLGQPDVDPYLRIALTR